MAQLIKTLEWGITLKEYEEGSWGATNGRTFHPPYSMQTKFATANGWDADAAFQEIATVYINLLKYRFDILKSIPLARQDLSGKDIFKPEVQEQLRSAVYNAIQFACSNKNVWERVTGAGVSATTFSVNVETTGWVFSSSAWGHIAWTMIETSDMEKYEMDERGNIHWCGVDPNTILATTWMTDKELVASIIDYMQKHPELFKGDKGADGKSFNLLGNLDTFADIKATAPSLDDAWVAKDTGVLWLWNGTNWINMGHISTATQKQQFREVNKEGVDVLEPFAGQPMIMEDASGKEINSNHPNAVAKRHEIPDVTQANDWMKIPRYVKPITIKQTPGGPSGIIKTYEDLDLADERTNFMNTAEVGRWYTFMINAVPYFAQVKSGDKATNFLWNGFRIIAGGNGDTLEFTRGSTSAAGNSVTVGSFTGDAFSSSIAQLVSYGPLQYLPKDVIVQLINDIISPAISDGSDPTWRDLDGTQATLFNPSQITITLTNSGIVADEDIQLILGSTAGDLVLDETIHVYGDVVTASQNGYVAGVYKWYMYVSGTDIKFVMEASDGSLTDTTQTLTKIRRVAPRVQTFDAHYTSQAAILQNSTSIGGLAKGASLTVTLPGTITIDTMTQLGLSVSGTTDWVTMSGWDKVTPFYASVMTEDTGNTWWIEYKVEPVPGDKTKIKITNFISGNQNDSTQAYRAHWIHFKGGK